MSSVCAPPLVSCVMPTTADRRRFVQQSIKYFLRQDYPNKELLIVDDGSEAMVNVVPDDPQVRYVHVPGSRTLGAKRNLCIETARGDLIMHWDDDDWMSPRRISYQTSELLRAGAEICGLRQMIFYELATGRCFLYEYPPGQRPWLAGGSLLYTREFWRRAPFPDVQVASDTRFVWSQRMDRSVTLSEFDFYVALIHSQNTSAKNHHGAYWSPWPGNVESLMGTDYGFYHSFRNEEASELPADESARSETRTGARAATVPASAFGGVANESPRPLRAAPSLRSLACDGVNAMRIGYVLTNFSPLPESFIRREVLALCNAGHRVYVYTHRRYRDPQAPEPTHENLVVREIPFTVDPTRLTRAALEDGIEHLHASLMSAAHRAAFNAAQKLQTPFTLMAYSGHDIFTRREPELYREASHDPLCAGIVVEDDFMSGWMTEQLGAAADKIRIVPNSLDLDLYCLPKRLWNRSPIVILSIARFVEKKGLIYLIHAFHQLCAEFADAELRLIGYGPEEQRLRQAAAGNPRIKFLGAKSEAETREAYADADIFCLPCIRTSSGDADGVPTTVLEAMAFKLPVVSSNLLSMPCYVRDDQDGILIPPGDVAALSAALARLCRDAKLRAKLGRSGRAHVAKTCDIKRNVETLQEIFSEGRAVKWREKLNGLERRRQSYTPEREHYYAECRTRAVNYFLPRAGKLLDIGCGDGELRLHLPPGVEYFGCDPLAGTNEFRFVAAAAEKLPFADNSFESAVLYAVLIHVFDVDRTLAEAARVLKPGGRLYLQECYNDPNPVHLNHFSPASLRERVAAYFNVVGAQPANDYLMMMIAEKPGAPRALDVTAPDLAKPRQENAPTVSICITTYNRAVFVRECIDSVLRQTFPRTEVVVVDDGSTDDTRRVLESYGSAIRVFYNETNQGIGFSKNRALLMSSGESRYVGILDSDDYFHPAFVERCVEHLERNREVGLVYTDDILVDLRGRELTRQGAVHPWDTDMWLRTRNLRGDTWLARRELVMRTRLHDLAIEPDVDYDLFYQLLEITKFGHLPEFLVFIRQHSGRTTFANRFALARAHAANLVKHGYSPHYAYLRARSHPEWIPAIEEGISLGRKLSEARRNAAQ